MTFSRLLICAGLAIVCALTPASSHPPGVADEDQAVAHEVEALREYFKRTANKRDRRGLRALYAENFVHVSADGRVENKEARIASIMSGDANIETARADDLMYRVFGDHTIIVSGKTFLTRDKQRGGNSVRWTSVYVKSKGEWQIVASQETPAP